MAMAFWPDTDYTRMVALFNTAQGALTPVAPWAGFDRIYDPESFFQPPALSDDPTTPKLFGVWGFESHEPVETMDPDTAGERTLAVALAIFQQKPASGGSATTGAARALASALWVQLQAASVAGLTLVPQSMRWLSPPLRDYADFFESRMTMEIGSS